MEFSHKTVLFDESIKGLKIRPDGIYVDGTLGGGGHAKGILEHVNTGYLIGIDQDKEALTAASQRLKEFGTRFKPVKGNFSQIDLILKDLSIKGIHGMILDLGVSSYQLDAGERGFSYQKDAPLDMRMDQSKSFSAEDIVNGYEEQQLENIIKSYGEERWAKRIAKFIVKEREQGPIKTTGDLVQIIKAAVPAAARKDGPHPAKRTFQAIRIEVNGELSIIENTIKKAVSYLVPGGRMAIITFHSLEDRIVKTTFKDLAKGCVCPPEFPVCVCNKKPLVKLVNKKPILPSEKELEENPRARSAKLRIVEKENI